MQKKSFYTAYDIAEIFDICYAKALEWIKFSGVKYVCIGRKYRVNITEFQKHVGITS